MKAKLFIIALLLSGAAYGQKLLLDKPEVHVPNTVTTEGILKLIHASSDIYVPVLVEYMLHKAYIDYCYADSVEYRADPNTTTWHDDGTATTTLLGGYTSKKRPHESPTLEGYVEWLDKLLQ